MQRGQQEGGLERMVERMVDERMGGYERVVGELRQGLESLKQMHEQISGLRGAVEKGVGDTEALKREAAAAAVARAELQAGLREAKSMADSSAAAAQAAAASAAQATASAAAVAEALKQLKAESASAGPAGGGAGAMRREATVVLRGEAEWYARTLKVYGMAENLAGKELENAIEGLVSKFCGGLQITVTGAKRLGVVKEGRHRVVVFQVADGYQQEAVLFAKSGLRGCTEARVFVEPFRTQSEEQRHQQALQQARPKMEELRAQGKQVKFWDGQMSVREGSDAAWERVNL